MTQINRGKITEIRDAGKRQLRRHASGLRIWAAYKKREYWAGGLSPFFGKHTSLDYFIFSLP